MMSKIATGEVHSGDAKLLKVWCKKEKMSVVVNAPTTDPAQANMGWTTAVPVTEIKEVGTEKCKSIILIYMIMS